MKINKEDRELIKYLLSSGWKIIESAVDDSDDADVIYFRKKNRDLVFTIEEGGKNES